MNQRLRSGRPAPSQARLHQLSGSLAVGGGGGPPEAEARALACLLVGVAQGGEDVGNGGRSRLAGRGRRGRQPEPVEFDQEGLIADPWETQVGVLDEAVFNRHGGRSHTDEGGFETTTRFSYLAAKAIAVGG